MKLICGIIVADEKGKVGKEGKVCKYYFIRVLDGSSFSLIVCNVT